MNERRFHTQGSFEVEEHVDLEECHQTPIHKTALIQPHGALIELDEGTQTVRSVSANVDRYLSVEPGDAPGENLEALFDPVDADRIKSNLRDTGSLLNRYPLESVEEPLRLSVFSMGESWGLEIEPPVNNETGETAENLLATANDSFQRFGRMDSLEHLYAEATRSVRRLTGYDRVMLYRFDEDGHGLVEAEDKLPELHSYLDQRFPASDIPEPARRLYGKNRLRYIPRTQYEPVPLIGPEGEREAEDLDLTYSSLRNVPLVHRQYLRNMNVGASVSISLMVDDELWGLIACHARDPSPLSGSTRDACKLIGQSVSGHIHQFETERRDRGLQKVKQFREQYEQTPTSFNELFDQLKSHKFDILPLLRADAFILRVADETLSLTGESVSIPEEAVEDLVREELREEDAARVESVVDELDSSWTHSSSVSGFLAFRIGQSPDSFCAWIRPEYPRTIQWGGDPRNPVEIDEEGTLSPRSSFEEWTQVVEDQCPRWTEVDVLIAEEMLRTFEESLLEVQSDHLRKANREKETLIREIHHRVKNNFDLAASLVGLQKREVDDPAIIRRLDEIHNRLYSMAELHRVLYTGDTVREVNMKEYATKILRNIRGNYQSPEYPFSYDTTLEEFTLPTDQAMYCGLILSELVSDSIEHGLNDENGSDSVVTVKLSQAKEETRLLVEDNGPGWEEDFDPLGSASFGLKIVRSLARDQLNGSLRINGDGGATFEVRFPAD